MKKQTENTKQPTLPFGVANVSEPPEVSGGSLTLNTNNPPVTTGGSDTEHNIAQLQAENEQLKATLRLDAAHRQVTGELAKAGARSPELLWDALKGDLQFADDGTLQNAAALMQKLRDVYPDQFGTQYPLPSIDAGAGTAAAPQLTRDALSKMTAAEIAELDWNDVKRVLAA